MFRVHEREKTKQNSVINILALRSFRFSLETNNFEAVLAPHRKVRETRVLKPSDFVLDSL